MMEHAEQMPERIWAYVYRIRHEDKGVQVWQDTPVCNDGDCHGITEYLRLSPGSVVVPSEVLRLVQGLLEDPEIPICPMCQEDVSTGHWPGCVIGSAVSALAPYLTAPAVEQVQP